MTSRLGVRDGESWSRLYTDEEPRNADGRDESDQDFEAVLRRREIKRSAGDLESGQGDASEQEPCGHRPVPARRSEVHESGFEGPSDGNAGQEADRRRHLPDGKVDPDLRRGRRKESDEEL